MQVSRAFLRDFATCANYHGWDEAKIAQVKDEIRADPRLVEYWQRQAELYRASEEYAPPVVPDHGKTECIACSSFNLKRAPPDEARKGYGRCMLHPVDVLMHITRQVKCRDYSPGLEPQVEARRTWWIEHRAK
jgi:hypothetical protein